jgi:hypothetical protein
MQAFPHLRVNGTSMNMYYDDLVKPSDENYDEIFAIDPPHLANPLGIECKKLSLNERRHQLKIDDAKASNILDFREGANDFNKYLRIASGPVVGRSVSNQVKGKELLLRNNSQQLTFIAQTQQPYFHPNYIEKIKTYELNDNAFGRHHLPPTQPRIYEKVNKNIFTARLAPLELNITKIPFSLISSASTTRMTPVMSLQFITTDSPTNNGESGFRTSSKMPSTATRKLVKLPTLNRSQKFQNEIVGRSISAVGRSEGRDVVMRRQFVKMDAVGTNTEPKI